MRKISERNRTIFLSRGLLASSKETEAAAKAAWDGVVVKLQQRAVAQHDKRQFYGEHARAELAFAQAIVAGQTIQQAEQAALRSVGL